MHRLSWFFASISLALTGFAGIVSADPVSTTGPLPSKIDELDNAFALLQQGKYDEAYKQIQEAKRKYPILPPPRLTLFRMMHKVNPKVSRPILEQAAAEEPEHPEVFLTLASVSLSEGRISDTILNALKVLELSNASRWTADQKKIFQREARAALANSFEARRDWENARTHFAAWLDLDSKNSNARQRFGAVLFNLSKPDEANIEFQTAAKDDSTLLPASVMMARQYVTRNDKDKGDLAKATEFFEKALKEEANNARVRIAYADFLLQQGNLQAAQLHTQEAAKLDAKNMDVRRMQGFVARYAKDNATATRVFQEIYAQFPADFIASNQLAIILADMNDDASKKKALQFAEVNYRQYQDSLEALSTLGYCYLRNGDLNQAQQAMQQLVKGVAGRPMSHDMCYFLAAVLGESKEGVDDAKKILKESLAQSGLFFFRKEAKTLLDKLEKENPSKVDASVKDKDKPKGN
jgi:tetratricopeptide (TPR) repeat protein